MRLHIHVVKEINIYLRAARKLSQTLDRPIGEVKRMLGLTERITSVDAPSGRDHEESLLDTIADEQNTVPSLLLQNSEVKNMSTNG